MYDERGETKKMSNQISELTRRNLLDELFMLGNIEGRIDLIEFLLRAWPLDNMPSTDSRFKTARQDIWQHMINNYDWDEQYLYRDYLELRNGTDEVFINFLAQIVHPVVRVNKEDQQQYVDIINKHLDSDGFKLQISGELSGYPIYCVTRIRGGVKGNVKNLIFAADGPKPEIVLKDSVNNDILITKNSEHCLVYDKPILSEGLLWKDLIIWWKEISTKNKSEIEIERDLYKRLFKSLDSEPEQLLFHVYFEKFRSVLDNKLPALIPQVYLHYDPYTMKQLQGQKRLPRQRMDFLLLLPNRERVVIEVDGKQHYSDGIIANVNKYAEMVSADRELKLKGYEVYRFGGAELIKGIGENIVEAFFRTLFNKHSIQENNHNTNVKCS